MKCRGAVEAGELTDVASLKWQPLWPPDGISQIHPAMEAMGEKQGLSGGKAFSN
jgi:hypothetical protein